MENPVNSEIDILFDFKVPVPDIHQLHFVSHNTQRPGREIARADSAHPLSRSHFVVHLSGQNMWVHMGLSLKHTAIR